MVEFNLNNEAHLSTDHGLLPNSMAFDGCNYFFTVECECAILVYDTCFCKIDCIKTCRRYTSLCYDPKDNCFFAVSDDCKYVIYKLDTCFNEIDCISIISNECCPSAVVGLSYYCTDNSILIATTNYIMKLNKQTEELTLILTKTCSWFTGVLAVSPGYITFSTNGKHQTISLYNKHNTLLYEQCLPKHFILKDIIWNPCTDKTHTTISLRLLALKKGCYPYIYTCNIPIYELGYIPSSCNYNICKKRCDKKKRHTNACNDVLESVALVEASLSHILNAEGEKLQKVIATTDDVSELLAVNQAVNKTIISATHLEQVLYDKIVAIKECCDFNECDHNHSCHDDHYDKC